MSNLEQHLILSTDTQGAAPVPAPCKGQAPRLHSTTTEPWHQVREYIPEGYSIQKQGVYLDRNSPEFISGPCWVSALTRTNQGTDWGKLIHWIDQDGKERNLSVPAHRLSESRSPLAGELASLGLMVVPGMERRLMTYLGSFKLPTGFRMRSVSQLGWLTDQDGNPRFVLPERTIGIGSEEITFQPEQHSPTIHSMHIQGTLEQWQEYVAKPCTGNPLLVFMLCTSFAGCLLKYTGLDSGGFHLFGQSSKGKTTALQITASVWGCGADPAASEDAYIGRWNTTGNALEATAAAHNDGVLLLDEMGTCDARNFGKVVYDLFGGRGKSRLNKNSTLQAPRSWRIMGLSTGEIPVHQKIEEDSGRKAKTGQIIRLVDIPIGEGVILNYHGQESGAFVNQLKKACGRYYGHAGSTFLEALIKAEMDTASLQHRLQREMGEWEPDFCNRPGLETHKQRVMRRFAAVTVAGILACRMGILPFEESEVVNSVLAVCDAWLRDDDNLPESVKGILAVRDFLLRHEARIRNLHDIDAPIRELVGYRDEVQNLYLMTDDGLKEACLGFHEKSVLGEMDVRGYLVKREARRFKSKYHIPGKGRIRLYGIRATLLEFDGM